MSVSNICNDFNVVSASQSISRKLWIATLASTVLLFSSQSQAVQVQIDNFGDFGTYQSGQQLSLSAGQLRYDISTPVDAMPYPCCAMRSVTSTYAATGVFGGTRTFGMFQTLDNSHGAGNLSSIFSASGLTVIENGGLNSAFMHLSYNSNIAQNLGLNNKLTINFNQLTTSDPLNILEVSISAKGSDNVMHSQRTVLGEGMSRLVEFSLAGLNSIKGLEVYIGGNGDNSSLTKTGTHQHTDTQLATVSSLYVTYDLPLPVVVVPVTPVPEPETYGMMLMGLGLMGFITRRRKSNQA